MWRTESRDKRGKLWQRWQMTVMTELWKSKARNRKTGKNCVDLDLNDHHEIYLIISASDRLQYSYSTLPYTFIWTEILINTVCINSPHPHYENMSSSYIFVYCFNHICLSVLTPNLYETLVHICFTFVYLSYIGICCHI